MMMDRCIFIYSTHLGRTVQHSLFALFPIVVVNLLASIGRMHLIAYNIGPSVVSDTIVDHAAAKNRLHAVSQMGDQLSRCTDHFQRKKNGGTFCPDRVITRSHKLSIRFRFSEEEDCA